MDDQTTGLMGKHCWRSEWAGPDSWGPWNRPWCQRRFGQRKLSRWWILWDWMRRKTRLTWNGCRWFLRLVFLCCQSEHVYDVHFSSTNGASRCSQRSVCGRKEHHRQACANQTSQSGSLTGASSVFIIRKQREMGSERRVYSENEDP